MKIVFKIIAALVVLVVIALLLLPFILEKNVDTIVRNAIDGKVNAQVDYADIDLSLIKSFPKAQVAIKDLSIVTNAPFANDTLIYAQDFSVNLSISQFFKKTDEEIQVDKIKVENAVVKLLLNKAGVANYDIAVKDENPQVSTEEDDGTDAAFGLDINYEINNARIVYADSTSQTYAEIDNLVHSGNGSVSAGLSDLDTKTNLNMTYSMGGINYTTAMPVSLYAVIGLDLENQKYTFKENTGKINQIPLTFSGWVQVLEDATAMDIKFNAEQGSFKDLLASIPSAYQKDIRGVSANGNFDLHGSIIGQSTETSIPTLDIHLDTKNASFKYPDLPKTVTGINIIANVLNTTGKTEDTHLDIDQFTMKIDEDAFAASGKLTNLINDPTVNARAKGVVNLANLKNAYPIGEQDLNLTGIVNADVQMNFSQSDIDKEQYQNVKSEGEVSITNFVFESEELPNAVNIATMAIEFTPAKVNLQKFAMTTGSSDLGATGTLENIIPFMFSDKVLKGDFNFTSNSFKVSDFMTASAEDAAGGQTSTEGNNSPAEAETEGLIPSFLDITSRFNAKKVYYDNLELANAKGTLAIKNQKASLSNISADFFDGSIGMLGEVSTAQQTPSFDMELDLSKLNITKSFEKIEMLQKLAPIASAMQGLFSSSIKVKGDLNDDLTPNLNSLSGNASVNLLNAKVLPENNKLLSTLNQKTDFVNFDKLNLNNMQTSLEFNDGKIQVKPFDFKLTKDITVTASGAHGFDAGVDYNLAMDVPAKYLGSSAAGLLSKLSATEQNQLKVPVPVTIGGSLTQPKVGVDLKTGISSLTQQVVANQKTQLTNKVKDKVNEQVSDKLSGKAKDVVGGLLGSKTTQTADTTKTATETTTKQNSKDAVKDAASKALNGLFNRNK